MYYEPPLTSWDNYVIEDSFCSSVTKIRASSFIVVILKMRRRAAIKFCFKYRKSAKSTFSMIPRFAYKKDCLSRSKVLKQYTHFKNCPNYLGVDPRVGCPSCISVSVLHFPSSVGWASNCYQKNSVSLWVVFTLSCMTCLAKPVCQVYSKLFNSRATGTPCGNVAKSRWMAQRQPIFLIEHYHRQRILVFSVWPIYQISINWMARATQEMADRRKCDEKPTKIKNENNADHMFWFKVIDPPWIFVP